MKIQTLLFALTFCAVSLNAQEPMGSKPWKDTAEASLVSANGNSKSATSAFKNIFNYQWTRTALELAGSALSSQNKGVTTAEQYSAYEKLSWTVSKRNYIFEKSGWERDKFAGFEHRYDTSVGVGRELIKRPKDFLAMELGGGYINEQRVRAPRNDFSSARAFSRYIHNITPTSKFSQNVEYLANLEDSDDFRVNTVTDLTASINSHFSLKVAYTWKHVGAPPPGFTRNDTLTSMALIAVY